MTTKASNTEESTFENAFSRLEKILERMHAQDVTLEESLALFEEANALITLCHRRLSDAEKRVEVILKNRQGDIKFSPTGEPEAVPLEGS